MQFIYEYIYEGNCLGPSFRNRTGSKENQAFTEEQKEILSIISP